MSMRIAITGGCGFVGTNLAKRFVQCGYDVVVLDNLSRPTSFLNLAELMQDSRIKFIHGDIRRFEDITYLRRCDAILHCGAQSTMTQGETNPFGDFTNNTLGVLNILEIVKGNRVPLIYWASNKVYPSSIINSLPVKEKETRYGWDCDEIIERRLPWLTITRNEHDHRWLANGINEQCPVGLGARSFYGSSKICGDIWCQEYRDAYAIPIFVNRFSCIAGPNQYGMKAQGWYVWFIVAAVFGIPLTYYGWRGKQVRDVLFVDDMVDLIEKQLTMAIEGKSTGGVYNIGGGCSNSISLREHVEMIKDSGLKVIMEDEKDCRRCDALIYISDNTKAQNEFGWHPTIDLETGFKLCSFWVQENYQRVKSSLSYL